MRRAVIYARFSSDRQREESIEGQVRECQAYAARRDLSVIEVYADRAMTGTNDRRPEFQRMIADAKKHKFDVLLCWKHDRFARNRYDAAMYRRALKSCDVTIEYAAETTPEGPEGIIFDSIMEGYAEYYSANLSQNVKRGLYDSALKRQTLGQTCFGYSRGPDGRYVLHPLQAPLVKRIFEEFAAGKPSTEIAKDLDAEGVRSYHGMSLAKNAKNFIARVIGNPKYKGVYQYADIYDEHGVPPIVSVELWDKANKVLDRHRKAPAAKKDAGGYILTGKLFCGHCGASMTAASGVSHSGRVYKYYACNGNRLEKRCKKKAVDKDWVEDAVVRALVEIVHSDAVIDLFADRFSKWQETEGERAGIPALEAQLADLDKKIHRLALTLSEMDAPVARQTLSEMERERQTVADRLGHLLVETPSLGRDEVRWWLERFREGKVDDPEWRAYLVEVFLQKAYLFDDGRLLVQLNYSGDSSVFGADSLSAEDLESVVRNCPQEDRQMVTIRTGRICVVWFAGVLAALVE